jgi:hypothetical protein
MTPFDQKQRRDRRAVPPPPGGPSFTADDEFSIDQPERADTSERTRTGGNRFDAELDASELDDRMRPGSTWAARAREISRSSMVIASRRMCYHGRLLVLAVHLIDDSPVPLLGRVAACEYEADGLYRTDLELLPMPTQGPIRDWVAARSKG